MNNLEFTLGAMLKTVGKTELELAELMATDPNFRAQARAAELERQAKEKAEIVKLSSSLVINGKMNKKWDLNENDYYQDTKK